MSEEDISSAAEGSEASFQSNKKTTEKNQLPEGMPMVEFLERLLKRFRVLRYLPTNQKDEFELEVVKLLVNEDERVDMSNYELLTNQGLEAFVLEVLAIVVKNNGSKLQQSKLERDLEDINQIVEEKMAALTKREKALAERDSKLKCLESTFMDMIKRKAETLQKEIIEAMGKRENDLMKRLNNRTRELKIKADILKDRIVEVGQLNDRVAKLETQQRGLKEKAKTMQKRQEYLKKKQLEVAKLEAQSNKAIEESTQFRTRVKDLEKKLGELNNTLSEKARLLAGREAELTKLKTTNCELELKIEGLEQSLQTAKKSLKQQKLKQKQSPMKLLEEELNISAIVLNDNESFVSAVQQQQAQLKPNYCRYTSVIDKLIASSKEFVFDQQLKRSLFAIFCNDPNADCPHLKQLLLKWVLHDKDCKGSVKMENLSQPTTFHAVLIVLLGSPLGQANAVYLLDNLTVDNDQEKQELVEQGYLLHIIQQIGLKQLPNQPLNCAIVSLMLRSIEQSSLYDRIIRQLSKHPYLEYMQTLFEKYEMEEQIIENLSVLLSRCCLSGGVQVRPSFLHSLKRKLKVLPNDLPKRNLQSVLDSVR